MTTSPATIEVAVLLGLLHPQAARHFEDIQWLRKHSTGATYALTGADLPRGGCASQGMTEYARLITVPADSNEADSARHNSKLARAKR